MASIELTMHSLDSSTYYNLGIDKARAQCFLEGDADKIKNMSWFEKFVDFFRGHKQATALSLLSDIMNKPSEVNEAAYAEPVGFEDADDVLNSSIMSDPLYASDEESYATDLGIISKFYMLKNMAKPQDQHHFRICFNDNNELIFVIAGKRILTTPIKAFLDRCKMGNSTLMEVLINKASNYNYDFDASIHLETSLSLQEGHVQAQLQIKNIKTFLNECSQLAELKDFMSELGIFRDDLVLTRLISIYHNESTHSPNNSPSTAFQRMAGY
ncbi:MAG: hypothetical protein HAW66_09205 [Shewanella sp.]|nr:hypothetical protein [Shewanella sp.]